MFMRKITHTLCVVLLMACSARQAPVQVYTEPPQDPVYRPAEVIVRNTSWEDPELAAKGLGRMEFVVRVSGRPAQTISQALVDVRHVRDAGRGKRASTNDRGVATFDSLAVGRYQLTVRAIGYASAKSEMIVLPGCRTDIEVYIGVQALGLAPPPPEPSHTRVTTCRSNK
jgi:hypothetical protein